MDKQSKSQQQQISDLTMQVSNVSKAYKKQKTVTAESLSNMERKLDMLISSASLGNRGGAVGPG